MYVIALATKIRENDSVGLNVNSERTGWISVRQKCCLDWKLTESLIRTVSAASSRDTERRCWKSLSWWMFGPAAGWLP